MAQSSTELIRSAEAGSIPDGRPPILGLLAGGVSVLLGLGVITGWFSNSRVLIQVHPSFVPMQFNTALGFLLCGLALLSTSARRRALAVVCGAVASTIGLLTLLEYVCGVDLGIDELLMKHYVTVKTSHPGRMAPNTAVCFTFTGAALLALSGEARGRLTAAGLMGGLTLLLGATALVGYATGAESVYGWGRTTRMAVHTALGFLVLGSGVLSCLWASVSKHKVDPTSAPESARRAVVLRSIGILTVAVLVVALVAIRHLYTDHLTENRRMLTRLATTWGELIEAVARYDLAQSADDDPEVARAATLSQIADARGQVEGLGGTGEFTLAKREGDRIVFLIGRRRLGPDAPPFVPLQGAAAEPMRLALEGGSGTIVGLDHRDEMVLAAYRHLPETGWGLVVKVGLSEIRAPFTRVAVLAIALALVVILVGAVLTWMSVDPLVRRITRGRAALSDAYEMVQQEVTERRRGEKMIRQQTAQLTAINRVFHEALVCETEEEVAVACLAVAEKLTHSKFSFIGELDEEGRFSATALTDPGWDACAIPKDEALKMLRDLEVRGIWGRVLKDGESLIVEDPASHPDRTGVPEGHPPLTAFLGVPLKVADKTFGMIAVANREDGYDNTAKEDLEALSSAFVEALMRRRAELALRRSEANYRSLIQNSVLGIYRSDVAGKFLDVNPAMVAMLGYGSAEDLLQLDLTTDVYVDRQRREELLASASGRQVFPGSLVQWKRKDGSHLTVRLSGRSIRDEAGELLSFEMTAEDVTERQALEERFRQSQKLEGIGKLAGGVAHDFNNLLTVIGGQTALALRRLAPDHPTTPRLQEIQRTAERAGELTRQLLAFSRRQILEPKVLDLKEILTDMEGLLRRVLREDIQFNTCIPDRLWSVRADPSQLEQVLLNLAVNARDAMPAGGTLTVELGNVVLDEKHAATHVGSRPGKHVMLAVSDTGEGLPPEVRERIFEPFFTTKRVGKGTGLGLAMVYGTVKQSGGSIYVYSEPGTGSTFKIYLPVVDASPDQRRKIGPADPPPGGSETILLVEDEEGVRKSAEEVLRDAGYRVHSAADGLEAGRVARQIPGELHLLLTDVIMPGLGGRGLHEELVMARGGLKVLFMSGYTDNAIVHHGVLEPGTRFLGKPFSLEELLRKVREVLDSD